jgi:hypothetical protein
MTKRSARNVETLKKKQKRRIERPKLTRNQGNTATGRRRARKQATLAR